MEIMRSLYHSEVNIMIKKDYINAIFKTGLEEEFDSFCLSYSRKLNRKKYRTRKRLAWIFCKRYNIHPIEHYYHTKKNPIPLNVHEEKLLNEEIRIARIPWAKDCSLN